MPYRSRSHLPEGVKNVLPKRAQDIYKEAFNSAYDAFKVADHRKNDNDREVVAHKVAWSAVKRKYEKGSDDKWHPK